MGQVAQLHHKALIHIVPPTRPSHRLNKYSEPFQQFKCHRCYRELPEAQFGPVHYRTSGGFTYLHPFCNLCRRHLRSEFSGHEMVTPRLQRFVGRLVQSARMGAARRGLVWALDDDDVLRLYVQQGGKCALTGLPMTDKPETRAPAGSAIAVPKERYALSVDRVDSAGNYTLDNVQLVCRVVNVMKLDMSLAEFRQWCERVVNYAGHIERELLKAVS